MSLARVSDEIALDASPAAVWAYVTDPDSFAQQHAGIGAQPWARYVTWPPVQPR